MAEAGPKSSWWRSTSIATKWWLSILAVVILVGLVLLVFKPFDEEPYQGSMAKVCAVAIRLSTQDVDDVELLNFAYEMQRESRGTTRIDRMLRAFNAEVRDQYWGDKSWSQAGALLEDIATECDIWERTGI